MNTTDWKAEREQRRRERLSQAGAPALTPGERRQVEKVQRVLRRQVEDAADAVDEALLNPEILSSGRVLATDSPLRALKADVGEYDRVLSEPSLATHLRQGSEFWRAAYAVAFADEDSSQDPVGALHFTQILDAFRAILLSMEFGCAAQSNIACMQQGKSGSASAKYLFHPLVRWVVRRQKLHSFYLVPNLVGLADQILREFSAKYQLFAPFRLRHPNCPEGVSIGELFSNVLKPTWDEWDPSHPKQHVLRVTRKRSIQSRYQAKLARLHASPDDLVQVLIDESDAATERTGVLDGMIGTFVEKVIRGEVPPCLLFLHTATAQEHQWSRNFTTVLEHQGAAYRGFPFCEGEPFPNRDGASSRPPLVVRYAEHFGIEELDFRSFKCPLTWLKNVKEPENGGSKAARERRWRTRRDELEPEWNEYRRTFERRLADLCLQLLEEKRVSRGAEIVAFPHARGVVVRPIDRNYDQGSADELAGALERLIAERGKQVRVVRFFGENARRTAKELIAAEAGGSEYIVLVTGKARRGDAFPRHCAFAIDLTPRPSTLTAVLQGLFGRMCGWGKDTAFLGSRLSCDILDAYGRRGRALDVIGFTQIGVRVEPNVPGFKGRLSRAGEGFTVAELLQDRVEQYVEDHPDAAPVLNWMRDVEQRLDRQRAEGRVWQRAVVAGHRKRGRGNGRYTLAEENCREFLLSFEELKVAETIERHPGLCCTSPEGSLAFTEIRLLHYRGDEETRREALRLFREQGTPSDIVSTAGLPDGSFYGDHVGRRQVQESSRHTMGKATTYHGRKEEGEEDRYTVQLWWEHAEGETGPVCVPRVTLALRDRHPAQAAQVADTQSPLRTKPQSIYSNEVIVGAGGGEDGAGENP